MFRKKEQQSTQISYLKGKPTAHGHFLSEILTFVCQTHFCQKGKNPKILTDIVLILFIFFCPFIFFLLFS